MEDNCWNINQYTVPAGLPILRENLANFYNKTYDINLMPDNFVINTGGKMNNKKISTSCHVKIVIKC